MGRIVFQKLQKNRLYRIVTPDDSSCPCDINTFARHSDF